MAWLIINQAAGNIQTKSNFHFPSYCFVTLLKITPLSNSSDTLKNRYYSLYDFLKFLSKVRPSDQQTQQETFNFHSSNTMMVKLKEIPVKTMFNQMYVSFKNYVPKNDPPLITQIQSCSILCEASNEVPYSFAFQF